MIRFYNTLTKRKETFRPLRRGKVTVYNCGPTVYDYAHIGNFRAYVFADLLRRYLEYKGFNVRQVMNITDVDDKTIKNAGGDMDRLKKNTKGFEEAFFEDTDKLNIKRADVYPRARAHIKDMVNLIKKLLERGYAYQTKDGIYFSISKFKDYGKFAGISLDNLKRGARVKQDEYDKENAHDFVLWKFRDKEKDGDVFWETDVGTGRPGWHIECSAMSMKYLGETFDIHTGGIDLIFPHHQNEIAQSEAATGKQFVKYWLHNQHLNIGGEKMSKSLGNFCTLRQMIDTKEKAPPRTNHQLRDILFEGNKRKKNEPITIRYALVATHYRQPLNLTGSIIRHAEFRVNKFREFVANLKEGKDARNMDKIIAKAKKSFESAMDDDLNISRALAAIFNFMHEVNRSGGGHKARKAMLDFDRVLGLGLSGTGSESAWKTVAQAKPDVRKLIGQREEMRKRGKWAEADRIRKELNKNGILLEDTKEGARWRNKAKHQKTAQK